MGLLDGIEKLINEHGSAVILKERIALANDQYSILEQKFFASECKEKQLKSENTNLHLDLEKAQIQVKNLENQLSHNNVLTLKYGIYWDKNGNPYCPKCKTPTTHTAWATYMNSQIRALKCSCSKTPFILMDNGEPIHAQDAMKLMANA